MTDENKLIRANGRGSRAAQLLENELLIEAFKNLEDAYSNAWRTTFFEDIAGREKLFLAINVVGKVKDHLQRLVTNGKLAQAELTDLARTAERKKRFGII